MRLSVVDLMQVPVNGNQSDALENAIDLAVHLEKLGYTRYWLAEHHGVSNFASCAPEIVIPVIAGKTQHMRVGSGGILLNHYTAFKVAEQFLTLHSLFPRRIDLGFGRAGGKILDEALIPSGIPSTAEEHTKKVEDLLLWLGRDIPKDHPYAELLMPDVEGWPQPWALGRSVESAISAAKKGLPYACAAFISPETAEEALLAYHRHFRPSTYKCGIEKPYAALAIHVVCADEQTEAERLAMSARALRKAGNQDKLPLPDAAIDICGGLISAENATWPPFIIGTPDRVAGQILDLVKLTSASEVIIQDMIALHDARLRSYELIAKALL